jgi:hypothetical protein
MDRKDDAGVLRTLAARILEAYRKDARFERILLFAALEGHELGLAHHRRLAGPVFELLRDYIARRQRDGALRDYNAGLVIAAIAGMAQMAQNYAILYRAVRIQAGGTRDPGAGGRGGGTNAGGDVSAGVVHGAATDHAGGE